MSRLFVPALFLVLAAEPSPAAAQVPPGTRGALDPVFHPVWVPLGVPADSVQARASIPAPPARKSAGSSVLRSTLLGGLAAIPIGAAIGGGLCAASPIDDDGTVYECAFLAGTMALPVGLAAGFGVGRGGATGLRAGFTGAIWGGALGLGVASVVNGITAAGDGAYVVSTVLAIGVGSALVGGLAGWLVG